MSFKSFNDQDQLKQQYRNSDNLGARIALHQKFSTNPIPIMRWQFDMLLAAAGTQANVLEVGCGRADLWDANRERVPSNWDVTLTDFSSGMLDDARAKLGDLADRFTLRQMDTQQLDFADGTFDCAIANFMLYHVPDVPQAIRELYRVLKPGGVLFTTTLGRFHMLEYKQLVDEIVPGLGYAESMTERPYSNENAVELLGAQFSDIVAIPYDCNLQITEIEPYVDYVRSIGVDETGAPEFIAEFRRRATELLNRDGVIRVRKDTCAFIARR